ncbi:major facilitator superfamily permease [Leifsonia xyli subsp. cynodontis DSM 46306]|uniref:Major facilitator superfamily (MFS) profile domain-containing protein n=1 Tax=Leifsonia xyli subsp. cynodontis DSM 46306 TaxID=1389489 RepID=U3PDJ6_LEIXC|nr:MFS transporter [Leifsonia xyli]AGW41623.1 major facilitator superfamily permease [Leifsonia xyli subsp. cynodontis DSM 46306]
MNSRRSWLIFGVGVFAYLIAVTQRTSIGVAGVSATERFHVSAAVLSTLAVVQLIVYAGMQIPVGVLIDRVGSRWLMLAGTALMVAGQVTVALAPSIAVAILGRILVGAGDATVFTSLIRLVTSWFRGRIVPQLSQWSGNIGQLGQVLSAIPFALLLHQSGWTTAFLSAASLSLIALIGILVAIADRPVGSSEGPRPASWADSLRQLRISLARPGTQLGFWSHFATQSPGTVFSLMWGLPFMVFALGIDRAEASGLLIVPVVAGLIAGPLLGLLTARFPLRRSNLVLGIVAMTAMVWGVFLLWPGVPPTWMLLLVLIALGIGGPGSLIGFDFARTSNPLRSLGSANGIVNVGGFLASFVMMFLIGLVLDAQNHTRTQAGLYALDSFRWAFAVQYLIVGVGVGFLLHARRRTRRRLQEDEGIEVGPLWVALVNVWRRRGGRNVERETTRSGGQGLAENVQ